MDGALAYGKPIPPRRGRMRGEDRLDKSFDPDCDSLECRDAAILSGSKH